MLRWCLAVVFAGASAFCAFGFLATFEPLDRATQLQWRMIYGVLGGGSLVGMMRMVWGGTQRRKASSE